MFWKLPFGTSHMLAASIEFSVAAYARATRSTLGEPINIRRIAFEHPARFAVSEYEAAFECAVSFSAPETRLDLDAEQLFRPSPSANPDLLAETVKRYSQPGIWMNKNKPHTAHSYFYLSNELNKSPLKLGRMAAAFGLTERTLRRRLVEEGHPFRELLDHVRKDLCALYLMEATRPLGEVAELLGYSELSAFSRSYRRWYGTAPRDWKAAKS